MTCRDLTREHFPREALSDEHQEPANRLPPSVTAMAMGLIAWFVIASVMVALLSIHLHFAGTESWVAEHSALSIISGAASTD
jgi:hypothetical protein